MSTTTKPRKNSALSAEARQALSSTVAKEYTEDGMTVRAIATKHALSFGLAYKLLGESKVTMRGRGGSRVGAKKTAETTEK